ncbi:MAG: hypothetical protein WD772_10100 [Pseudohongiellaceae bacterium]
MPDLQRITSLYIETEDRFQLTGETTAQGTVAIWLTQRLLSKLLPHLVNWLEQGGRAISLQSHVDERIIEHLQDFAQLDAQKDLTMQPAVSVSSETPVWLAHTIDVVHLPDAIKLVIKGDNNREAGLLLNSKELRQWLSILRKLWTAAAWPDAFWPIWIKESLETQANTTGKSVH